MNNELIYIVISKFNRNITKFDETEYFLFYFYYQLVHEVCHSICRYYDIFNRFTDKEKNYEEEFCDKLAMSIIYECFGANIFSQIKKIYEKNIKASYINLSKYDYVCVDELFNKYGIKVKKTKEIKEKYYDYSIINIKSIINKLLIYFEKKNIKYLKTILLLCDGYNLEYDTSKGKLIKTKKLVMVFRNMTYSEYLNYQALNSFENITEYKIESMDKQ